MSKESHESEKLVSPLTVVLAADDYERMPIAQVDSILGQLLPEYWTAERLQAASPSDKRQAVRRAFSARGRGAVRAGGSARLSDRAATSPVSEAVSIEDAPPKSDMMSDLPPEGFAPGDELTMELDVKPDEAGYNYSDYSDLDPGIVTDAKIAATLIRGLVAEIAEETVTREMRIGRELLAIKVRLGHGHFGPWLAAEFGWSDRQARRYMRVAQGKVATTEPRAEDVDAYMTRPETASRLYGVALTKLREDGCFTQQEMDALWFVEPSAGTGNFFNKMPIDRRIGIDISPLAPGIIRADFLTYELPLAPGVRWGMVGNIPFGKGMPIKCIDRGVQLGTSFFALVLPHTILRPSMQNKINLYFERIHHEVLPDDSFLRDGQVKYSPSVFQVWIRRDTPREPIIEQTVHPDWEWLPANRKAEATAWMQNYGYNVGDIKASDNLGRINSPTWHWFIRCEPDVLARLKAIDWRSVALPTATTPTLTKGDVVRAYSERCSARCALTTECVAEPGASREPVRLIVGDCLDVLSGQPGSSVNLIMTSPPYGEARQSTYGGVPVDQYVSWWMQRAGQFRRVLRPDGSLIVNIKESVIDSERATYVLELIQAMRRSGWLWTEEYIWHKKNSVPGKWPNRFRDAWERCLHFTLQREFVMYQDAVVVPMGDWAKSRLANLSDADRLRGASANGSNFGRNISHWVNRNSAYPTNVLHMATECRDVGHPAAYPEALPEWFIRLFTREGGLVLDPFVGSGTTGVAAKRLGREFIGIDLLGHNIELARVRIAEVESAAAAVAPDREESERALSVITRGGFGTFGRRYRA